MATIQQYNIKKNNKNQQISQHNHKKPTILIKTFSIRASVTHMHGHPMPARYSRLMFDFVFYWFSFFHQMFRKLVQESGVKGQTFMSNWHNQCVQIKLLESLTFTTSCAHNVKTQLENLVLQNFNLLHWRVVILCVARNIPLLYSCINDQEFQRNSMKHLSTVQFRN